jgi:hypothetical protein
MWNMFLPYNMVENLTQTKYSYISAYKSWKSVMIIMFSTSTEYIKLAESNMYNTQVRFATRSEV